MPDADDAQEWHRRFGAESFNDAWALIEQAARAPEADLDMLLAAAASRWHQGRLGDPERVFMGDWQVRTSPRSSG